MPEFRSERVKIDPLIPWRWNLGGVLVFTGFLIWAALAGIGLGELLARLKSGGLASPAPSIIYVEVTPAFPTPDPEAPPALAPTAEPPGEPAYSEIPELGRFDPGPQAPLHLDPWEPLDLASGAETYVTFYLNQGAGSLQVGFYPFAWFPGIFDTPVFDPEYSGAISWTDNFGRRGIWTHSGPDQTMTPFQRFIERDKLGFTVAWYEAEHRLDQNVQNASINFVQVNSSEPIADRWGLIVAWARIPPDRVQESLTHVMDLPAYLLETQPERGWQLIAGTPDALILYFCGRQLAGEEKDPSRPYWQQTRYVLGIVPGEPLDLPSTSEDFNARLEAGG